MPLALMAMDKDTAMFLMMFIVLGMIASAVFITNNPGLLESIVGGGIIGGLLERLDRLRRQTAEDANS